MGEPDPAVLDPKDLLLADLAHFGEALHRNEEMGEKRLSFFLALVTAVVAGLAAVASAETLPAGVELQTIARVASIALLAVGMVTYLRMVQRNTVTDEFKETLKNIRQVYATRAGLHGYTPIVEWQRLPRGFRGGYAETVALANGGLAFAALLTSGIPRWLAAIVSALIVGVLWALASIRRS